MFEAVRRGIHDQNPQYGFLPESGHQSGGACILFRDGDVPMKIQTAVQHASNPRYYRKKINPRILVLSAIVLSLVVLIAGIVVIINQPVKAPVISQGVIYNGFELSMETEPGAEIFYTLDGSEPTRWSHKYSSPIKVFSTTKVNAISVKGIRKDSEMTSELVVFDLPNAADPAKGATATAQSSFSDFNVVYGPENAIDGNPATIWRSDKKTRPTWIEVHFDGTYEIEQICIQWFEHMQGFDVSLSMDGKTWDKVLIGKISNNQAYGSTVNDYQFAKLEEKQNFFITPQVATDLRIDIIATSSPDSDNYFSEATIAEIQAFGRKITGDVQ